MHTPTLTDLVTEDQLHAIARTFYDELYVHPRLGIFFRGINQRRQEQRLISFILMTGGEHGPIEGRYLSEAHAHMFVTPELFELRADVLEAAIRTHGHGDDVVAAWRALDDGWRSYIVKDRLEDCSTEAGEIIVAPD